MEKQTLKKKCLVKSTAGTWELPDSMQPTAGKEAEAHHGQSPGERGLTNLTFWILWHFIYSTQLSIALDVKLLIHQATRKCLPLGKDTLKPVRPVWIVHPDT